MATREQLFARLEQLGVETKTVEHPHVYTVEEVNALDMDIPGQKCKNLFLKDHKGLLWLVVARDDATVHLGSLLSVLGASRKLRFASSELLKEHLGVEPGSVTPFGLINDVEHKVRVALDKQLLGKDLLSFHPLECNASTAISPTGLVKFLDSTGHTFTTVDL